MSIKVVVNAAGFMNADLEAQKAIDRLHRHGFELLSETEKTTATVWLFVGQIENNGFARFFCSGTGDIAFNAPIALQSIGAIQMASIAARANDVFGEGGPPRDRQERKALVKSFNAATKETLVSLETAFLNCPEDADDLLEQYLIRQSSPAK